MQKDLRLVMEAAAASGTPLPATALIQQMFCSIECDVESDYGTQALVKALERLCNTEVARSE
jgi:3-hydroxyisobutyrate dehydrogenase-like beta-hydroxyacid dehydrogenase